VRVRTGKNGGVLHRRKDRRTINDHFLAPGFVPTNESIARIFFATDEPRDLVRALWENFEMGVATPKKDDGQKREMHHVQREYDEQIAAMDLDCEASPRRVPVRRGGRWRACPPA